MSDARISAPMLRQKSITPVAGDRAGRVWVQIELQEEVMNNLRVLVEDDRLLTGEKYLAPIPEVETGETDQRYITLESAGRDEIVVAEHEAVDPVSSEQAEWRMLSAMLGRGLTQAYAVKFGAADPQLVLRAEDRKAVETAKARIGLAKAVLTIDVQGAYRGSQLYRVDNSLEQYLIVQLPKGAQLWTVHVAGEPVKPAADASAGTVRIPLVKTAPGDADYAVVLKYGGQLGRLAAIDHVDFPLMRTVNIHVELSQVELYAPPSFDWFDFGGTMRLVPSEGDLTAGLLEYNTKQIGLAIQSLRSEDSYAKARAANNLKALQLDSARLKQSAAGYAGNTELAKQLQSNSAIQLDLGNEINAPADQVLLNEDNDNRSRLGDLYRSQAGSRANDVVSQSGENFQYQPAQPPAKQPGEAPAGQTLNRQWFAKNKLENPQSGFLQGFKTESAPNSRTPQSGPQDAAPAQAPLQPAAPSVSAKQAEEVREMDQKGQKDQQYGSESSGKKAQRQLQRYAERLEQQQALPQSNVETHSFALPQSADDLSGGGRAAPFPQFTSTLDIPLAGSGAAGLPAQQAAQQAAQSLTPTALASLDVDLHPQGKKYLFTTPRGDVEVTARAMSDALLGRLIRVAGLVVVLLVLMAVTRRLWSNRLAIDKPISHTH